MKDFNILQSFSIYFFFKTIAVTENGPHFPAWFFFLKPADWF